MQNHATFVGCLVVAVTAQLAAQCTPSFTPLAGLRGFSGNVRASVRWDPDGAGPLGERLVIGGDFRLVGATEANGIVAWDPATGTWTPFGSGMFSVTALAVLPNGQLIAGGAFSTAGGVAANCIARWTGTTWAPLGSGVDSPVVSLCVRPNGDLIVGGGFGYAGGLQVGGIARWNGTAWASMGTGTNATVQALATLQNGDVVAGGWFTYMNGVPTQRLARWNGSTWSEFGGGIGGEVHMLRTLANGDLLCGGQFSSAGGVPAQSLARWNGTTWSPLGPGINAGWNTHIRCATQLGNGDLIVGGQFDAAFGAPGNHIARWNGSTWSPLGTGVSGPGWSSSIESLTVTALADGSTFAGGTFLTAGGATVNYAARWNGALWSTMQTGMDSQVSCSVTMPNGDIVFGGGFTTIGAVTMNHIARWDGTTFHPLGSGLNNNAADMVVDGNGDLIVVGGFTSAGGVPVQSVARWNGSTWTAMDQGINGPWGVSSIVRMPNGDLWCAGYPHAGVYLSRWNGSAWTPVTNGPNHWIADLAAMPNGDLIAIGNFLAIGALATSYIARFDGSQWHPLGSGLDWLGRSVYVTRSGSLVATGSFAFAGGVASQGIARWNGSTWQSFGGGFGTGNGFGNVGFVVRELPNGDLLVVGNFGSAGGVPAQNLARWNGSAWSAVGNPDNYVFTLSERHDGSMFVGGWFLTLGNQVAPFLAKLTSPCPATAPSLGGGCPSSGGANTLVAAALPWLGSTFRGQTSGIPTQCLVVAVTGFQSFNLPLASALPQGVVGCVLRTTLDHSEVLLPQSGLATSSLPLPSTPALVGTALRHQMVPLELDGGGNLIAVTASNVLALTLGSF